MDRTEPADPSPDAMSDKQLGLVIGGAGSAASGGSPDIAARDTAAGVGWPPDIHPVIYPHVDGGRSVSGGDAGASAFGEMLDTLADQTRAGDGSGAFSGEDLETALDTLKNNAETNPVVPKMDVETALALIQQVRDIRAAIDTAQAETNRWIVRNI